MHVSRAGNFYNDSFLSLINTFLICHWLSDVSCGYQRLVFAPHLHWPAWVTKFVTVFSRLCLIVYLPIFYVTAASGNTNFCFHLIHLDLHVSRGQNIAISSTGIFRLRKQNTPKAPNHFLKKNKMKKCFQRLKKVTANSVWKGW